MGNASASCKGDVSERRSRAPEIDRKRPGATGVVRLFFFLAVFAVYSTVAFSQDLSAYAEKLRSGNIEEKREALFQLRNLRSEDASRIAVTALRDSTPIVRATAASSVIFLPKTEASAALLPLLRDKDEFVRREGAFALGQVGDPAAGSQLVSTLSNDKSAEVKTAAAIAIGKVGDPAAVSVLVELFDKMPNDDNELLRSAAARSIGQIAEKMRSGTITTLTPQNFLPEKYKDLGTKPTPDLQSNFTDAVRRLTKVLESSAEADDTRREAAFALGAIGEPSAEPALSKYVNSADPYLAEICREALMKLKAAE